MNESMEVIILSIRAKELSDIIIGLENSRTGRTGRGLEYQISSAKENLELTNRLLKIVSGE